MTLWLCTYTMPIRNSTHLATMLAKHYVRAERWYDVRDFLRRRFPEMISEPECKPCEAVLAADTELRWIGHDAGRVPGKQMQFRDLLKTGAGGWTEWQNV